MSKKQEDRAMDRIIRTLPQKLIFFILMPASIETMSTETLKVREIQENVAKPDDDEKLIHELSLVASDFYKKIIETTMLYFTGVLASSDQFHKQLMIETSKHMMYASQIVAKYLPKLLQNPKISWKIKLKRCAYITSILIIIIVWMKEVGISNSNIQHQKTMPPLENFNQSFLNIDHTSDYTAPRQRPSLT